MKRFIHWLTYSVSGNIVGAVVFYPLGLIWWSVMTDLYWTVGGLAVNLVLIHFINKKAVKHEHMD